MNFVCYTDDAQASFVNYFNFSNNFSGTLFFLVFTIENGYTSSIALRILTRSHLYLELHHHN